MRGRKPQKKPDLRVVGADYIPGGVALADPPEEMPEPQAQVWRFFAANAPRGHLTAVDGPLLSGLCDMVVAYDLAVDSAQSMPILVNGERGQVFNPAWRAALRFQAATIRALEALALTPGTIARTRSRP